MRTSTPRSARRRTAAAGAATRARSSPGKRYEDWELADPAGKGVDAVRPIRDEIKQRIFGRLESLDVTPVNA